MKYRHVYGSGKEIRVKEDGGKG